MFHFKKAAGYGHHHNHKHKIKKQDDDEPEIPEINLDMDIADEQPNSEDWKRLHEVADNNREEFKQTFLQAAERTKEETALVDLADGFNSEDVSLAQGAIDWESYEIELEKLQDDFTQTIEFAGKTMILELHAAYSGFQFNVNNPQIIKWITEHTGELITDVTARSRQAVNNVILDTYLRGLHPDKAARHINDIVGLTQRQAKAVDNFLFNAIEQGVNERQALEQSQKYADKLLRYRAENIARTESMMAANRGYGETIRQGINQNVIPATKIRKVWITTPDDRLCSYCRPLNGDVKKLDQQFKETGIGRVKLPPLHPQCRCTVSYRILD